MEEMEEKYEQIRNYLHKRECFFLSEATQFPKLY
jgi:hypothetical protein